MRNCTKDEGGPFGFGDQEPISSHRGGIDEYGGADPESALAIASRIQNQKTRNSQSATAREDPCRVERASKQVALATPCMVI